VGTARRRVSLVFHPSRQLFLVLTLKGLDFVDEWLGSVERVPPNITKLYQLLLQTIRIGGVIGMRMALRLGYSRGVIKEAVSNAYVDLTRFPKKPEGQVLRRIEEMVGKPPREMYV